MKEMKHAAILKYDMFLKIKKSLPFFVFSCFEFLHFLFGYLPLLQPQMASYKLLQNIKDGLRSRRTFLGRIILLSLYLQPNILYFPIWEDELTYYKSNYRGFHSSFELQSYLKSILNTSRFSSNHYSLSLQNLILHHFIFRKWIWRILYLFLQYFIFECQSASSKIQEEIEGWSKSFLQK